MSLAAPGRSRPSDADLAALSGGWSPSAWLGAPAPGGLALPSAQPTDAFMYAPRGVHLDADRLVVADTGNHRVLIWNEVPAEDGVELRALVEEHQRRTGSVLAGRMLADWARSLMEFRQLVPVAAISVPAPAPEQLPEKEAKTVNQA